MSTSDLSTKNTKNEILDAYHEVLQQLKENKKINKQDIKREQDKQAVVEHASQHTTNEIVKNLADLKLSLVKSLEDLENQLLSEHKKLIVLQQAMVIQNKDLEEIYEIKINTDTLAALLEAQKQRKEAFDKEMSTQHQQLDEEMSQKRLLWKQEQVDMDFFRKEQEAQQKKLKTREEEEYSYKRDLDRQKERDQYEAQKHLLEKELTDKKASVEKELSEREADILMKEQELLHLKLQVEEFPVKLQQAIADTEKTITERLQFKSEYEAKLTQKEVEGERKLHQQMIAALELKITQQDQQIKELTQKANHAGTQVQEIAVKAIEGASRQRFYPGYSEKSSESNVKI